MDHKVIHEHSISAYYERINHNYEVFQITPPDVRKMAHITTQDSRNCYFVEKQGDDYYFPYFTTTGLCVKITNDEATYFLRGKECDRVVFGHPDEVRLFFNHLGSWYYDCICYVSTCDILITPRDQHAFKWTPTTPMGTGELQSETQLIHPNASMLDVCTTIFDIFSAPYFLFKFGVIGIVAFSRDEIKRYKKTGSL